MGRDFHRKSIERDFTTKWKPIFKMMEQCELIDIPPQVDETFVQSSFLQATEYLRSRAGCIWEKRNERVLLTWSVGTWSHFAFCSKKYDREARYCV